MLEAQKSMKANAFVSSTPLFASITQTPSINLRQRRRRSTFAIRHQRPTLSAVQSHRRSIVSASAGTSASESKDDESNTGLNSPDFVERIRAATSLSSSEVIADLDGTPERVKTLLPVAQNDSHSQVRFVALSALAAQPADALSPDLRDQVLSVCRNVLAEDKEPSCRCGAADAIAGLRLNDGFDDLVAAYNSEGADWMLRLSIVAGMGEMQNEKSFEMLASVVNPEGELYEYAKSEPLVLAAAVGALGDLGDMRALPLVSSLAKEGQDEAVRERATIAVQMLEKAASL